MTTYFWREKNALSCADKHTVFSPTKNQLEKELVLKLKQKLDRIDVVFDKNARAKHYANDKKPKSINLEGLSEKEIQHKLGLSVVVDFVQILRDICNFYGIDFENLQKCQTQFSLDEIKSTIQTSIDLLLSHKNKKEILTRIFSCIFALSQILNLNSSQIEKERLEKEQKQGNFLHGKYVRISD